MFCLQRYNVTKTSLQRYNYKKMTKWSGVYDATGCPRWKPEGTLRRIPPGQSLPGGCIYNCQRFAYCLFHAMSCVIERYNYKNLLFRALQLKKCLFTALQCLKECLQRYNYKKMTKWSSAYDATGCPRGNPEVPFRGYPLGRASLGGVYITVRGLLTAFFMPCLVS